MAKDQELRYCQMKERLLSAKKSLTAKTDRLSASLERLRELFERPALDARSEQRMLMCDASMKYLSALPSMAPSTARDLQAGGDTRDGSPVQAVAAVAAAANRRGGNSGLVAEAGGDCKMVDRHCRSRRNKRSSCPPSLGHDLSGVDISQLVDEADAPGLSPLLVQQQHASAATREPATLGATQSKMFVVHEGRRRLARGRRSLELIVIDRVPPPLRPLDSQEQDGHEPIAGDSPADACVGRSRIVEARTASHSGSCVGQLSRTMSLYKPLPVIGAEATNSDIGDDWSVRSRPD